MTDILPAIIPQSFDDLSLHVARVKGLVPRVQIDIANGSYAPTKTWPYTRDDHFNALVSQEEGLPFWEDISYELDMLIREPEVAINGWINAGISGVVVHIESTKEHQALFTKAKDAVIELGWGIKPNTSNEELFAIIDACGMPDFIQCMGSNDIGRSGISLDEQVYEKINALRLRYPDLPIAVDIGVNQETAPYLIEAGATKLVAGSAIFGSSDVRQAIDDLQQL